jgi:gliding motility-associated-like protein
VFTINNGGVINPTTGEIDLDASGLNTFTIKYSTTNLGNPCPDSLTVSVTITSAPSAQFTYDLAQYCQDSINPLPTFIGLGSGGVFSFTPAGLSVNSTSGAIDLSLSTPGTYRVYNNIAAYGGCAAALDSADVEILQVHSALFNYSTATHCITGTDPIATLSGTTGGEFTITAPGVIDITTGEIDLTTSGLGTFTVFYNTANLGYACAALDSISITITSAPSAGFTYDVAQYCQDSLSPVLTMNLGASSGTFSASPAGLTIDAAGNITLGTSTPGVHTIYNTVAPAGGCAAAIDSTTLEILQMDSALFNYATGNTYCLTGTDPIATLTGTNGGEFTITAPGVIDINTGEIDLVSSGLGTFNMYYNTANVGNTCAALDSISITITSAPTAGFTYDIAQYCQDSINPVLTLDLGASSGVFSATPAGLTIDAAGNVVLGTSTPGIYTIYNTISAAGGCAAAIDSTTLEILQVDSATFSYVNAGTYCSNDPNPIATLNGTTGGEFTITPTGVIDITTGEIDLVATGPGTYTVHYNTANVGNPCSAEDSTTITIVPQSTITKDPVTPICFGDPLSLTATGSGNGTITWYSDLAGTIVVETGSPFTPTIPGIGTFKFYVRETGTCASTMDTVTVVVGGVTAAINADPITGPIPLDVDFDGSGSTGNIITYLWDLGGGNNGSDSILTHTYPNIGEFEVMLVVSDGVCSDTAYVTIITFGESEIIIPNVFTPNGDNLNDVFTVKSVNLESVEGVIYNRWGQLMFSWDHIKGYWDGTTLSGSECPDGTYFYVISAKGLDGEEYFKKGAFSLIR